MNPRNVFLLPLDLLGRGGMGVVYLAKYLPMERLEVLRVLNPQMVERESARQRFVTEMRAIGKFEPSIDRNGLPASSATDAACCH